MPSASPVPGHQLPPLSSFTLSLHVTSFRPSSGRQEARDRPAWLWLTNSMTHECDRCPPSVTEDPVRGSCASHSMASRLSTADADTGPALVCGTESPSRRLAKSGSCRLPQSPLTRLSQLTQGPRPVPVWSQSRELRNSTENKRKKQASLKEEKTTGRNEIWNVWPGPPPCQPPKGDKPQDRVTEGCRDGQ